MQNVPKGWMTLSRIIQKKMRSHHTNENLPRTAATLCVLTRKCLRLDYLDMHLSSVFPHQHIVNLSSFIFYSPPSDGHLERKEKLTN